MWARTSSNYARAQGLKLGAIRTCARAEMLGKHVLPNLSNAETAKLLPEPWLRSNKFYISAQSPSFSSFGSRHLSSQAGAKSGEEENEELDEGFPELEVTEGSPELKNVQSDDETALVSEQELSDEDDAVVSELKPDTEDKGAVPAKNNSSLEWLLLNERKSVKTALDQYVSEGKTMKESDILNAMFILRKRKLFRKALQVSEWLQKNKAIDYNERHYATRVNLIAKVHGVQAAERYIETIPESFRGDAVYSALLASCCSLNNMKEAEDVFNKMKQLNLAASSYACNQMILIYKKTDRKKIADILLYMEEENIKPTQLTYSLLIDTKGTSNDVSGMDKIVETMKSDGIEPDVKTKAILAKHYISAGLKERAESILKEMEGEKSEARGMCSVLIPLYASLGKEDEVERIWKACEPNPQFLEYVAVIDAWGKLKQIEKAEAVFEELGKQKKLTSKHYSTMLKVYAQNKMLVKGKDLIVRMGEVGCRPGPLAWDALVKLYVEGGEVEKADSVLHKAAQQNEKVKPLFTTFMMIMEHYARSGDVHNTEKMLDRLKRAGYTGRHRPFQVLLEAYIKSGTPVYGFRERMLADSVLPHRTLNLQLAQVNPFRKTAVSDLLD